MKHLICISSLSPLLFLTACQSFEQKVSDVRNRLTVLETKGLPDSVVSPARLALVSAQDNNARNRGGEANKALNKALAAVKHAEEFLENTMTTKKPEVVAMYNALVTKVENDLRGLHKKDADSALHQIDSLLKIDFVFKAERFINHFEKDYPKMSKAQATADSLRPKINGSTWVFTETTKNTEDKNVNAVEKKTFKFNRDGTSYFVEEKKGQSSPNLKEEWKFETWGKWDIKGDTVWVIATKFTQHKQTFWQFNELTKKWGHVNTENKFVEGKPNVIDAETLTMEKNPADVLKQNRYITHQDLIDEYKRM
jgi:hypothetical protein